MNRVMVLGWLWVCLVTNFDLYFMIFHQLPFISVELANANQSNAHIFPDELKIATGSPASEAHTLLVPLIPLPNLYPEIIIPILAK